jgi:hypothetical protein
MEILQTAIALPSMRVSKGSLRLRVLPYSDEPLYGYVGRLARLHGHTSIRSFLVDYFGDRIKVADVFHGRAQAAVANLADLPPDTFKRSTPVRTHARRYLLNDEGLRSGIWSLKALRVCPMCLLKDREAGPGRLDFRAYLRTWWNIEAVRVCPFHRIDLIQDDPATGQKINWRSLEALESIASQKSLADASFKQSTDEEMRLSSFILARIGFSEQREFSSLVEEMELATFLDVSAHVGELIQQSDCGEPGTIRLQSERHDAIRAGSSILLEGREALLRILNQRLTSEPLSNTFPTPKQAYGSLYDWLAIHQRDTGVEEIRNVVVAHGLDNLRVTETDKILSGSRREVQFRTINQVADRLRTTSMKVTRFVESLEKVFPGNVRRYANQDIAVDKLTHGRVAIAIKEAMTKSDAIQLLGLDRKTVDGLIANGIIRTLFRWDSKAVFVKSRLEEVCTTIFEDIPIVSFAKADEILLVKTPLLGNGIRISDAIWLLAKGKLKAAGRLRDSSGLTGVVLKTKDVLQIFRVRSDIAGDERKLIGLESLSRRLKCPVADLKYLIAGQVIRPEISFRARWGLKVHIFDLRYVADLERRFVSLRELEYRSPDEPSLLRPQLYDYKPRPRFPDAYEPDRDRPAYYYREMSEAHLRLSEQRIRYIRTGNDYNSIKKIIDWSPPSKVGAR